jgi:hypothetical protein
LRNGLAQKNRNRKPKRKTNRLIFNFYFYCINQKVVGMRFGDFEEFIKRSKKRTNGERGNA